MNKEFRWNVDAPGWAFQWTNGRPYVCAIFAWSRQALIRDVEKFLGEKWKKVYRRGGRAIKVGIKALEEPSHA